MVIDASVILKWFIQENDSNKAAEIKKAHTIGSSCIAIPDLALYEIGNALRYKLEFSNHEVASCITEIYDLGIDIIGPNMEMLAEVTEISRRYDITFYDAVYIALSKELGLNFITADSRLFHKTKTLHFVKLL